MLASAKKTRGGLVWPAGPRPESSLSSFGFLFKSARKEKGRFIFLNFL